eukprot:TRINITY_DN9902_c0_g1_i2.p1 TRINITY_DN9902_c0_g1~~TRINITY_DN9902_c0_g1_i2.p1  ORF type:complete len:275 (+),score=54.18 TRINITY_DN9902_c0_g1_i2:70-894(+)
MCIRDRHISSSTTTRVERDLGRIRANKIKALAVIVNSPGGSAVQSQNVCDKLRRYCKEKDVPLYMFGEDFATSAGYFILCTGDHVYSQPATWLGSIGVFWPAFGTKKLLEELRFERRRVDSNELVVQRKYDPYLTENVPDDLKKETLETLLNLHQKFINLVETHRGDKLKIPRDERTKKSYQAEVLTAQVALDYGLIDGIGSAEEVLKRDFPDARIVNFSKKNAWDHMKERYSEAHFAMATLANKSEVSSTNAYMTSTESLLFYSHIGSELDNH